MYTLYRSPAAFYECLITVVIALLRTTAAQKKFSVLPPVSVWAFKKLNHIKGRINNQMILKKE